MAIACCQTEAIRSVSVEKQLSSLPLPSLRLITAGEKSKTFTDRPGLLIEGHFEGVRMSQSINWAYWQKLPEVKVFEAIALLRSSEPDSEPPADASPEYRKTLRLLLACLSDRSIFTPCTLNMGEPALHGVRLIEVGAWALANGYKLADKFPRPVQISKAPPPITPIRAAASYTPPRKTEPINWAHWQKMPIVKLEEAVALSLNINPEFVTQVDEAMIRRMELVLSNVDAGHLILNQRYSENQPKSPTSLAKFAAWAVKIELPNLPPELVALAETEPQATTASPAPAVGTASDAPAKLRNQRPDLLTPLIQKAQRDEPDPFSAAVIWPKLCDMAELKTNPFIGKTESGLKWIDANESFKFLTKEALADRLRRAKRTR